MPIIIPVEVRNDSRNNRWYAYYTVDLNINGAGSSREKALRALEKRMRSMYDSDDIELHISSETVNFPTGVSMRQYLESRRNDTLSTR